MKIGHVVNDLEAAGAQTMLAKLLEAEAHAEIDLEREVISIQPGGALAARIEAVARRRDLGVRSAKGAPIAAFRLARRARALSRDLWMGWMYHGYAAATIAWAADGRRAALVWNIRHSVSDIALETRTIRGLIHLGARLSNLPAAIVYNARVSADQHEALGFSPEKRVVLPNGFDGERFRPDRAARAELRAELGLDEDAALIGMVARKHPMKNQKGAIEVFARLASEAPEARLALVGRGMTEDDPETARWVRESGVGEKIFLLGERRDTHRLYPAFDVALLASLWGEGFPNVIGEAMACGASCVASDVGDAGWVAGESGLIVPAGDAEALLAALSKAVRMDPAERARRGAAGRERVLAEFSLPEIAARYQALYADALSRRG